MLVEEELVTCGANDQHDLDEFATNDREILTSSLFAAPFDNSHEHREHDEHDEHIEHHEHHSGQGRPYIHYSGSI